MNYKLLFRDASLTLFIQVITALSGVLVMVLISRGFGVDSYGEYYLIKRSTDVIWLLFLMGMTVSIPRNKSFIDKTDKRGTAEFAFLVFPLFSVLLYVLLSDSLMTLFLKDLKDVLGLIASKLVIGMIFFATVSSYLRATSKFVLLNLGTLINLSVIPITPFLLSQDIIAYLNVFSTFTLTINILFYIIISIILIKNQQPFNNLKLKLIGTIDFLKYGVFRLPGLFLASLIFTLPVIILNYIGSSAEIGSLGQVFQLFSIVSMPINALGVILLPNFSKIISNGQKDSLKSFLKKGNNITLIASLSISLILFLFIEEILYLINGEYILVENIYVKLFVFSIVPYSMYNFLRNPIDAAHRKPYSTILVVISFIFSSTIVLFLYKYTLISDFNLVVVYTSINLISLGATSYHYAYKLYFKGGMKNRKDS